MEVPFNRGHALQVTVDKCPDHDLPYIQVACKGDMCSKFFTPCDPTLPQPCTGGLCCSSAYDAYMDGGLSKVSKGIFNFFSNLFGQGDIDVKTFFQSTCQTQGWNSTSSSYYWYSYACTMYYEHLPSWTDSIGELFNHFNLFRPEDSCNDGETLDAVVKQSAAKFLSDTLRAFPQATTLSFCGLKDLDTLIEDRTICETNAEDRVTCNFTSWDGILQGGMKSTNTVLKQGSWLQSSQDVACPNTYTMSPSGKPYQPLIEIGCDTSATIMRGTDANITLQFPQFHTVLQSAANLVLRLQRLRQPGITDLNFEERFDMFTPLFWTRMWTQYSRTVDTTASIPDLFALWVNQTNKASDSTVLNMPATCTYEYWRDNGRCELALTFRRFRVVFGVFMCEAPSCRT